MPVKSILNAPLPQQPGQTIAWDSLHGSSLSLAIAETIATSERPILIVTSDHLEVTQMSDAIQFFSGRDDAVLPFPDWETLPYDHFSPHQDIISDRLSILTKLPTYRSRAIITNVTTLMQPLPPTHYLQSHGFLIQVGDTLHINPLRERLLSSGYHAVSQVREHGEFAIRGSIVDIFPMGSTQPFRIDLFDNEIENIRLFSPDTQRTVESIQEIKLLPAHEFPLSESGIDLFRTKWRENFSGNPLACPIYNDVIEGIASPGIEYYLPLFFESTDTLFDYLPKNTIILCVGEINNKAESFWHDLSERYEQYRHDIKRPLLAPHQFFLPVDRLHARLNQFSKINTAISTNGQGIHFDTKPLEKLQDNTHASTPHASLANYLKTNTNRILFTAETLGRKEIITQSFAHIGLKPTFCDSWQAFLDQHDQYGIAIATLDDGVILNQASITVFPETMLYGNKVLQRRRRQQSAPDQESFFKDLSELQINDAVVHIDHGIGYYRGLQTLNVGDQTGEFLTIEYDNQDKLYVPVSSLHVISRYTGTNPDHIPISKLGTDQWSRAKRKAAEKVRDVAAELLDLYAQREARPGFKYQIDHEQYELFSDAFPFEETPDQHMAIQHIYQDMSNGKAMDRVVCGDVGFGKTEVAMRAAYLAVQNNKQVAVLVPTTLLAQQHYENFKDRFANWPIQVDVLSRFCTAKESKTIMEKLSSGSIDIIIGTHKLLQESVQFKRLGLVIIDEEHRFGVKHKEKLRTLRSTVDFLTLTATPIPRTLNMALSGIRDLSIIATPPLKRLSVKTFVHEDNDAIIIEAIRREILRGGQVYFLHNDVSSIHKKADDIKRLLPECHIAVGHGQMHERELERIMSSFYHRQYNVLVCTTIIESGIDIPTANTIIINRADKLGLAQLHQLRGRVGRSHHQAYAYLLTPPKKSMTSDAIKRLDAIATLDQLGVGFTLATHDLEIRGAGELLGEGQSGNMHEIGFTLYMDMLTRAVDDLKSGREPTVEKTLIRHHAEIDLHLPALIPDQYLNDPQLRLQFYKKIAHAKSQADLDRIQVEMIDRFGLLSAPIKNLFAIAELRQLADHVGISKIDANQTQGKFEFIEQPTIKPETIIRLIQVKPKTYRLDGPSRIRFYLSSPNPDDRINEVKSLIKELSS